MVGPFTYLVLRANQVAAEMPHLVLKTKHANISNQTPSRLTDGKIRSSPDWNTDTSLLTTSCSRKVGEVLRLRPRRAAKFKSQDLNKAARLFSSAGASVSFWVLVKAILKS